MMVTGEGSLATNKLIVFSGYLGGVDWDAACRPVASTSCARCSKTWTIPAALPAIMGGGSALPVVFCSIALLRLTSMNSWSQLEAYHFTCCWLVDLVDFLGFFQWIFHMFSYFCLLFSSFCLEKPLCSAPFGHGTVALRGSPWWCQAQVRLSQGELVGDTAIGWWISHRFPCLVW